MQNEGEWHKTDTKIRDYDKIDLCDLFDVQNIPNPYVVTLCGSFNVLHVDNWVYVDMSMWWLILSMCW
jgi:hypothetical protein